MTPRRVPRFQESAQALLNSYAWPEGFEVIVDQHSLASPYVYIGGPGSARVMINLNPYDLDSADPARVVEDAIRKFSRQARDPRYTDGSRRDDQTAADLLTAE
jgi:hypothetical protein